MWKSTGAQGAQGHQGTTGVHLCSRCYKVKSYWCSFTGATGQSRCNWNAVWINLMHKVHKGHQGHHLEIMVVEDPSGAQLHKVIKVHTGGGGSTRSRCSRCIKDC